MYLHPQHLIYLFIYYQLEGALSGYFICGSMCCLGREGYIWSMSNQLVCTAGPNSLLGVGWVFEGRALKVGYLGVRFWSKVSRGVYIHKVVGYPVGRVSAGGM